MSRPNQHMNRQSVEYVRFNVSSPSWHFLSMQKDMRFPQLDRSIEFTNLDNQSLQRGSDVSCQHPGHIMQEQYTRTFPPEHGTATCELARNRRDEQHPRYFLRMFHAISLLMMDCCVHLHPQVGDSNFKLTDCATLIVL